METDTLLKPVTRSRVGVQTSPGPEYSQSEVANQ